MSIWRTLKVAICVFLDLLDFTIGRLPGVGMGMDVGFAIVAACLWGPKGFWHLWEVVDITEQGCAFVPTCTLIGFAAASAERQALAEA